MATIADMTAEDLKRFIEETIEERLTQLLGTFEMPDEPDEDDSMTWDEIRAAVERNRWTPPPRAKSALELLRENRRT